MSDKIQNFPSGFAEAILDFHAAPIEEQFAIIRAIDENGNGFIDVPAHDNNVHVDSEMFTGRVFIDGVDAVARIKMLERVVRNLLGLCDNYGAPGDFINEALYGCDDNGNPIPNAYLASLDPVTDWSLRDETS